jgi:hypothetical protein
MVFFAFFDPLLLADDDAPPTWITSRMTGYALGFFFFWIVTALSAVLTSYLLETLPRDMTGDDRKQNNQDRSGRAS